MAGRSKLLTWASPYLSSKNVKTQTVGSPRLLPVDGDDAVDGPGSGSTAMFEALVIDRLCAAAVSAVGRPAGAVLERVDAIM